MGYSMSAELVSLFHTDTNVAKKPTMTVLSKFGNSLIFSLLYLDAFYVLHWIANCVTDFFKRAKELYPIAS